MTDTITLPRETVQPFEWMHRHTGARTKERQTFMPENWVGLYTEDQIAALQQAEPQDNEADDELHCAEMTLDSLACQYDLEPTEFKCISDYIEAVVGAAVAKKDAALKACEKDAARYRLLRTWGVRAHGLYVTNGNNPVYDLSLDALLDAAITQGQEALK